MVDDVKCGTHVEKSQKSEPRPIDSSINVREEAAGGGSRWSGLSGSQIGTPDAIYLPRGKQLADAATLSIILDSAGGIRIERFCD